MASKAVPKLMLGPLPQSLCPASGKLLASRTARRAAILAGAFMPLQCRTGASRCLRRLLPTIPPHNRLDDHRGVQ